MEGRYPPGISVVFTNCKDAAQEDDYINWYRNMHLADVEASGAVGHAAWHRNAASELKSSEARYMAIYESKWADLYATRDAVVKNRARLGREGRIHPALDIVLRGYYARTGPEFRTDRTGSDVRGLLVLLSDPRDGVPDEAVNDWYDNTHVPEILATGLYHTTYRFKLEIGDAAVPKYAALYETDQDPLSAADTLRQYRDKWTVHPIYRNPIDIRMRSAFIKV